MASYLKEKFTGAQSDVDSSGADKYYIQVHAATSYDDSKAKQVIINGPPSTLSKNSSVAVRIKEYQGIPLDSPATSSYFEDPAHTQDTYSIAVSWIPEEDIDADDLVWGIELINPIRDRIPGRFITTAFNIVKGFVDSSLRCDPNADQPWLDGPILCSTAITFSIGSKNSLSLPAILSEGSLADDATIRQSNNIPATPHQRRKHFLDEQNRKNFTFEKGRCYAFDFCNGYIDWKNYALKLPGFSFGVLKYINDRTHTTRFVLKSRRTGKVCVATTFRLLYGEELEKAKQKTASAANAAAASKGEDHEEQVSAAETESQCKEQPQKGNRENLNGEDEQTREDLGPVQGPEEIEGQEVQDSLKSKELPGTSSRKALNTSQDDHAAEAAAEKVIEQSEKKRKSEQKTGSIEESLVSTASKDGRS